MKHIFLFLSLIYFIVSQPQYVPTDGPAYAIPYVPPTPLPGYQFVREFEGYPQQVPVAPQVSTPVPTVPVQPPALQPEPVPPPQPVVDEDEGILSCLFRCFGGKISKREIENMYNECRFSKTCWLFRGKATLGRSILNCGAQCVLPGLF